MKKRDLKAKLKKASREKHGSENAEETSPEKVSTKGIVYNKSPSDSSL
jgi:hypothetical protein